MSGKQNDVFVVRFCLLKNILIEVLHANAQFRTGNGESFEGFYDVIAEIDIKLFLNFFELVGRFFRERVLQIGKNYFFSVTNDMKTEHKQYSGNLEKSKII